MQIKPKEVVSMLESKFSVFHVNGFIIKASEPGELPWSYIYDPSLSDKWQYPVKAKQKVYLEDEKKNVYSINDQIFSCSPTHFWILKTQEFARHQKYAKAPKRFQYAKVRLKQWWGIHTKSFWLFLKRFFPFRAFIVYEQNWLGSGLLSHRKPTRFIPND